MTIEPASILAFRNGSIGNTLVAVPALRALRLRYPTARLSVVVDSIGYELLEKFPWIDRLIRYEKHSEHRSLLSYASLVRDFRHEKPTHAVLFKRFFRNGLLALLAGAPVRAGFSTDGKAPFLNLTIPYDESINIVDLNLKLAHLLGANSNDHTLEMHLSEADREKAQYLLQPHLADDTAYVVACYGGKTTLPGFMPLTDFVRIVADVAEGFPVVLTGAGRSERDAAAQLAEALPHSIAATDLPLRVSAALIERAALFIGFNSGPAHLSAAVKCPALVLFGPDTSGYSEPIKWLPVGEDVFPLSFEQDMPAGQSRTDSAMLENARAALRRRTEKVPGSWQ